MRDVRQMSQCARLLDRLERCPITPMEAWNELGVYRLAARVSDLKEAGHDIAKETVSVANRFGEEATIVLQPKKRISANSFIKLTEGKNG